MYEKILDAAILFSGNAFKAYVLLYLLGLSRSDILHEGFMQTGSLDYAISKIKQKLDIER